MAENLAYESEEYEIYTIDGMFFYTWAAAMDSAGV